MCKCPDVDKERKISMPRNRKSPDTDGLHPEVIKRGNKRLVEILYTIIKDAWENLEVPADLKGAELVTILKKGDRRDCRNYCGISLLPIPEKVFASILLNILLTLMDDFQPAVQCGFWVYWGTTEWSCNKYRWNSLNRICPATYLSTSQKR